MRNYFPANVRVLFERARFFAWFGLIVGALTVSSAWVLPVDACAKEKTPAELYANALKAADRIESSLVKAVTKVRQSSVSVLSLGMRRTSATSPPEPFVRGCGSGVLVKHRSKTWIITNVHVIAGAKALQIVTHDGVVHDVVEHDTVKEYDIALLKFAKKPKARYKAVDVNPRVSEKYMKEGSWVIATGNPFFLAVDGSSVTTLGVISGMDRYLGGTYKYVGAIQHDAEVNPGNSGGPLWDLEGRLVGINGKIATRPRFRKANPSNTGASFALPVHQIKAFLKMLVKDENAQAGYLGIETKTWKDDRGKPNGAEITRVLRGSPISVSTKKKKIPQVGCVITGIKLGTSGMKKVYTANDLQVELSTYSAGDKVSITFKKVGRKGNTVTWRGELSAPPKGRR